MFIKQEFRKRPESVALDTVFAYSILFSARNNWDVFPNVVKDNLIDKELETFAKAYEYLQEAGKKADTYIA